MLLFTGLPCHVAGLYAYLGNKDYPNLYSIDLVCHGITSQKVFDKFHQDVLKGKKIVDLQFKAKQPWGWHAGTNAKFEDGTKYSLPLEKCPYFIAYLTNISKNRTCGTCLFNKLPRQADLSIGDFWGIGKYDPKLNDNKGTSEVLVNNEHGNELLQKIKDNAKVLKRVPIEYALNGNGVLRHPYAMHPSREYFFKNIDRTNFSELVGICAGNAGDQTEEDILGKLDARFHGLYYLSKIVNQNYNGRKIVTWGVDKNFEQVLTTYFNLKVDFIVYQKQKVDGIRTRTISVLKGKSEEYYVISLERNFDAEAEKIFVDYGYKEEKDYVFRAHKPIVLENFDLSRGWYTDIYGNQIVGSSGTLKKVIFRGINGRIWLGKNIYDVKSMTLDIGSNGKVVIEDNCRFWNAATIQLIGTRNVCSKVRVGQNCRFQNVLMRVYGHEKASSILINNNCTFESNLELHANSGKRIIIGTDCMLSHDIDIWAGDGHSVFDINSGKNVNGIAEVSWKNAVLLEDHVWIGKKAFLLAGTVIGSGSIVGAQSVVKGKFPNNCVIAGNPAKTVKTDTAWSRDMDAVNIDRCGSGELIKMTNHANSAIAAENVLVIGGTRFMGIKLVQELLKRGNDVTIATRGTKGRIFGDRVTYLSMDLTNPQSVEAALRGKHYDVVFDNLAYCSNFVRRVLENIHCKRYVQLSSIEVYYPVRGWISEEKFNPYKVKQVWNDMNAGYVAGKQQAEAAVYQVFPNCSAVTVRIPYVTKTDRLYWFCKNIVNKTAMAIPDLERSLTFIQDIEVGKFLPWIAAQDYVGPINLASTGFVTVGEIIEYISQKTGMDAVIDIDNGEKAPFNVFEEKGFAVDMDKAMELGWKPSKLKDWFWRLMDGYISTALKNKTENK